MKKGFTLIELLVVIAIIGVLSSIVIASLGQSRNKGSDAAIKSDIVGIRAAAELYHDTNNSYGTAAYDASCSVSPTASSLFANATVQQQLDDAYAKAGGVESKCQSGGTWYVISAPLKEAGRAWCIDSAGASQKITFANHASGDQNCTQAGS